MTFARLYQAWAEVLAEIEERSRDLLRELDVRTAVELLPEWAELLRIAEDCNITGLPDTTPEIRFAVFVKLTQPGGQNAFHFVEIARLLGFDVDVTDFEEHVPFVAGSSCGDPLYSDGWRFAVTIHAPVTTPRFARTGLSVCGEPLCSGQNELLSCTLDRLKPAHVVFLYAFDKPYTGFAPWSVLGPDPVRLTAKVMDPTRI